MIAYQSNWYLILACLDEDIANYVVSKLSCDPIYRWEMELRPGRKYSERQYIRIKFIRE